MSATQLPKPKKEKERQEKIQQPVGRLKTVVRRLPSNLPEDIFWQTVLPWVTDETVTWKTYYAGKLKKRMNKENIPSRAYIAFKNEEQLARFSQDFDGHLFRDKAGNESYAIVEFAPYQKIPSEKRKHDNRNGTIEKDEDFISFLESLNAQPNHEPVTLEALIASTRPPSPPKTTPLLEALKAEKSAQKDKEAILRNHAHYKDQINAGNTMSSRKDEKKRGGTANLAAHGQKSGEPAVSSATTTGGPSKKGKKARESTNSSQGQNPTSAIPNASTVNTGPIPVVLGKTGATAAHGQPPKQTRQQRHQAKVPATAVSQEPVIPVIVTASGRPSTTGPSTTAAITNVSANSAAPITLTTPDTSSAPRRSRPVIGLASRQFEAALSGVAGGERKSRRERERERENVAAAASTPQSSSASALMNVIGVAPSLSNVEKEKPGPSTSPRRDRNRRGGGGGSGGAPAAAAHAGIVAVGNDVNIGKPVNAPPPPRVPSILHRPDSAAQIILQRDDTSMGGSSAAGGRLSPPVNVPHGGGARGGGRRGRGGRGVPRGS